MGPIRPLSFPVLLEPLLYDAPTKRLETTSSCRGRHPRHRKEPRRATTVWLRGETLLTAILVVFQFERR